MKLPAARLLLMSVLFAGWLGYLGYLVACRPHVPTGWRSAFEGRSVTLSRPQFLVSNLDVVAEIGDTSGDNFTVKEILFAAKKPPLQVDEKIHVENLDQCRAFPDSVAINAEPPPDFSGPGLYIVPLEMIEKNGVRRFRVVPTPPSPGYPPTRSGSAGPPRIYPASPELRAEYGTLAKPR